MSPKILFRFSMVAVLCLALAVQPSVASKPTGGGSPPPGTIFFSYDDGDSGLVDGTYAMNGDGSGKTLIFAGNRAGVPSSRIYGSSRWWVVAAQDPSTGHYELYAFRSDGSQMTQLTQVGPDVSFPFGSPAWSNDAQDSFLTMNGWDQRTGRSGWHLFRLPINGDIDAMVANGELPIGIDRLESVLYPAASPGEWPWLYTWSNERPMFAYARPNYDESGQEVSQTLWIRTLSESGEQPVDFAALTRGGIYYPQWSPDGSRIAFHGSGVWTVQPSGAGLTQLLTDSGTTSFSRPLWSPDSQHIGFYFTRYKVGPGNWERHVGRLPSTGGKYTLLTTDLPQYAHKDPIRWTP